MVKANPYLITLWAERNKCAMCKHRKNEGHLLPKGKFYPSPAWLFHYEDTHGLPHDITAEWLFESVYRDNNNNILIEKWGGLLED